MKEKDKFDEMAKAICIYMGKKGWGIGVIGEPRVQQKSGALKYNFELVFRFTGRKIKQSLLKKLFPPEN